MMSIEFFITSLFVVLAPGTGVIYTLAIGLSRGPRSAIFAALGCTFGITPHLLASVLGLAAILHTSAVVFETVKYVGVAYLLYLACQALKNSSGSSPDALEDQKTNDRSLIKTGVLINLLNPKLSIFFLAFLPQFIDPDTANSSLQMGILGLVFMLMTFVAFVIYGVFAAKLSGYVQKQPNFHKWFNRTLAGVFTSLSVKLALTDQ